MFANEVEEARFQALSRELRCTVCQNQSLADSDAPLARDLRRELYEMIRDGRADMEIRQFMVDRYGEFVLTLCAAVPTDPPFSLEEPPSLATAHPSHTWMDQPYVG